ncbi:MAG: filamentous hemagglutinin, partial [Cyanobacteria bacterium P01_D01_bin.56]
PSSLTAVTLSNGNGGNLAISTPQLTITDGGRIGATTFSDGNAGDLTVAATESIQLKGIGTSEFNPSMIIGSANIQDPFIRSLFGLPDLPTGQSGRILIQTPNLNLTEGAQINVRNDGTGDSGDLTIEGGFVALDQGSSLTAATLSGEGGNIRLNLDSALVLRNGSQLSSEAGGRGNGGNISINAPVILGIENSDITANAVAGNGGNISIITQGIIGLVFRDALTAESDITASSQFGVSGTVNISNFNNDITASLVELPSNLEDPANQIARGCSTGYNELLITGRGGVPRQARRGLLPYATWHDLREVPLGLAAVEDQLTSNQLTPPTDIELQEATYWQIATNGDLELLTNNQLSERLLANCTTQS